VRGFSHVLSYEEVKSSIAVKDERIEQGDAGSILNELVDLKTIEHYIVSSKEKRRIKHGIEEIYWNDVLVKRSNYVNGFKEGKYECWDDEGNIGKVGFYSKGLKHGKFTNYLRGTTNREFFGDKVFVVNYVNGKKEGKGYTFNEKDQIVRIETFANNKNNGEQIDYHQELLGVTPIKKRIQIYKNGLLDGKSLEFHKDGSIKEKTIYKSGIRHGKSVIYIQGGEKIVIFYENGKKSH